jgi:hypothetical protein
MNSAPFFARDRIASLTYGLAPSIVEQERRFSKLPSHAVFEERSQVADIRSSFRDARDLVFAPSRHQLATGATECSIYIRLRQRRELKPEIAMHGVAELLGALRFSHWATDVREVRKLAIDVRDGRGCHLGSHDISSIARLTGSAPST